MSAEQIITAVGLLGIGSVIPSIVNYFTNLRKSKKDAKQALKEKRYKVIILLCYAFVNYEREQTKLIINRPNIGSKEELLNELNVEWMNMSLYASDGVFLKMKSFLEIQTPQAYNILIFEMRKDLYTMKTRLKPEQFELGVIEVLES